MEKKEYEIFSEKVTMTSVDKEYINEITLSSSKKPFSRFFIESFKKILAGTELEKYGVEKFLLERPELAHEMLGTDTPLMQYADMNEKQKFMVRVEKDGLYFVDGTIIDSETLFMSFFEGRSPKEDDDFLSKSRFSIDIHRLGKSGMSCIILDKNENLFIFPYRAETIHHTFVTHGEDVIFAGMIKVNSGKITFLADKSGHYKDRPINGILFLAQYMKKQQSNADILAPNFSPTDIEFFDSSPERRITREIIKKRFIEILNLDKFKSM